MQSCIFSEQFIRFTIPELIMNIGYLRKVKEGVSEVVNIKLYLQKQQTNN